VTEFSRDGAAPPRRFRPNPGQLGQAAAMRGERTGQSRSSQPRRQSGAASDRTTGRALPALPESEGNNDHLVYALQHAAAQSLGRDIPFGLWAQHNGLFGALAPGKVPADWLEM
jgi:hypothetical protein